jgi:DNA-binding beta-propeller fold protein YncE
MFARSLVAAAFAACLAVPACAHTAPATAYRVIERIPAADGGWDFATIDAGKLYIARSDAITAIDLAGRHVTDALAPANHGHQVLVLDHGATLFETDGKTGLGRFVAAADGKILAELALGPKPDAAVYDPVTGRIAVMLADSGVIALVDPATRTLVGKITVGTDLEYAVADGKGGIFVNLEAANALAHVDLKAGKVTARIALPGCEGPTGLALVSGKLISACANEVATVTDARSGKQLARLPIGRDPDAVLVDAARGLAFIPCGGSGTLVALAIADPAHITVAAVIPTQVGAKTGAVDPRDGHIYLPTATLAAPLPGAKRGKPVPGSFTVLVVAPSNDVLAATASAMPAADGAMAQAAEPMALHWLDPASVQPRLLVPAPPPRDSDAEKQELATLHRLIAAASPERIARAADDGNHENPSAFNASLGRDLAKLPATWALLTAVQQETAFVITQGKDTFRRIRPYGVDATMPTCTKVSRDKPAKSYPSGHAGMGWSVGWTLARLLPDKAPEILARANDYALSRELCGVHFPSDTEASHVIGTLVADRLLADPRFATRIAAARAELTAAP